MSFTENLYLKRQLKQLQEENNHLKYLLEEASSEGGNIFGQREHHPEIQTHLRNASAHRDYYGDRLDAKAVPHLRQAERLLNAGHGSDKQMQEFTGLVSLLDKHESDRFTG
jgi:hypothetical protein